MTVLRECLPHKSAVQVLIAVAVLRVPGAASFSNFLGSATGNGPCSMANFTAVCDTALEAHIPAASGTSAAVEREFLLALPIKIQYVRCKVVFRCVRHTRACTRRAHRQLLRGRLCNVPSKERGTNPAHLIGALMCPAVEIRLAS